jgi:hypothetical protein
MGTKKPSWLRDNGLSIVMFALFFLFWAGQAISGWLQYNEQRQEHGRSPTSLGAYLRTGDFWEATTENWESEFFQMAAFVLLSARLVQRGSAESHDPDEMEEKNAGHPDPPRADAPGPVHRGGLAVALYSHSLSAALGLLFLISFFIHAAGGRIAHNEEAALHGQPALSLGQFLTSKTFWFQSFQNWQSEFMSVGALVVLSIVLRERGSPQSKPLDAPHHQTGS